MVNSININHSDKYIRCNYFGSITRQDIGASWNELLKLPEFTSGNYNLLSDYSQGQAYLKVEDIDEIIKFLKNIKDIIKGKKQAILVNGHFSTALSILFENEVFTETDFDCRTFGTEAGAQSWLKK